LYPKRDIHHRLMSVSVPIRKGDRVGSFFDDGWGQAQRWLKLARCEFTLGEWQRWDQSTHNVPAVDGFLLVSIDAKKQGCRGSVAASVDGAQLAGAAVHWFDETDNHINQQGFCVPVPKNSEVQIDAHPTDGAPVIRASWMPMTDERWRMLPAEPREPDVIEQADTDGFLTGWVDARHGTRACLAMYTGQGGEAANDWALPAAGASAHYYQRRDRWVNWSSAMVPVGKDARFKTTVSDVYGKPRVRLHWTPIVPA
jgi:hypothetical protein